MTVVKLLILLLVPVLLVLPFLPIRWIFSFSYYSAPNISRRRTLINLLVLAALALLCAVLMPLLRNFALWLGALKPIRWIISKIPVYAAYSTDLAVTIFANMFYCFAAFAVLLLVRSGERIGDRIKSGRERIQKEKKERKKKRKQDNKNNNTVSEQPQTDVSDDGALPEELLPLPEEPVTDNRIVLPGRQAEKKHAKKKKSRRTTAEEQPPEEKGLRRFLLQLYGYFYEKVEDRWFSRPQTQHVAKHLRNFLLLVGGMYVLVFLLLLIPMLFHVTVLEEPLYKLLQFFLTVNYLYPVLALAVLVLLYRIIDGKVAPVPPTEADTDPDLLQKGRIVDLDQVEANLMKICGKDYDVQSFFSGDVLNNSADRVTVETDKNERIRSVAEYVKSEGLELNHEYLIGVQSFFEGKNVLFHAPLYTAVGVYLYAALNLRILQGERVVVICRNRSQIPNYIDQMNKGFLSLTRTHKPLWKIVTRNELGRDSEADVLVLTSEDFTDERLFAAAEEFFRQVTVALLPDANQVVAANNYYCQVISQRLCQFCRKTPQYVFLSTRTTLNLDNALTEYFLLDSKPVYARGDYSYGDVHIYIWRTKKDGAVMLDNAARTMPIEVCISDIANQFGITEPNLISDSAIFSNQINPHWLDIYDASKRPLGFAIVADDSYNLPSVIYAYSRYIGKKASVLHVICRQYLLRNYFYAHAPRYLFEQPLLERSMIEHAKADKTRMVLLLCRLMEGIPVETFVAEMGRMGCDDATAVHDFNALSKLVDVCLERALGQKPEDTQAHFTLFKPKDTFYPQQYIRIHENYDVLGRLLEETELIEMRFANGARQSVYINLFRRMLDQRYLTGQNLVYANQNYEIRRIDRERGIIEVDDASNVHGLAKDYVQLRGYRLLTPEFAQFCRKPDSKVGAADLMQMQKSFIGEENIAKALCMVKSEDAFRVSSDTFGYYMIHTDGRSLSVTNDGIQVIRLPEAARTVLHREVSGGIYVRLELTRSRDDRLTMTLAVLLQEMMKTIFPDSYFCLSVCPILADPKTIFEHPSFASRAVAQFYSTLEDWGEVCPDSIELLIVDDCVGGTGAMNLLFDAEGTFLQNILWMLSDYLQWQKDNEKSPYIFFGLETQPEIFDLDGLRPILQSFSRNYVREYDIHSQLDAANRCVLCGQTIDDPCLWHGKKMICRDCAEEYTPDADEAAQILAYARKYLIDTFAIELPEFTLQIESDLPEDAFSALDFEQHTVRLAEDLPLRAMHIQILTQLVRAWQLENLDIGGEPMVDGQPLYVSLQYLRYLQQYQYARYLHRDYLLCRDDASSGYCSLAQALQAEGHDNSFLLLLQGQKKSGGSSVKKGGKKNSTRSTKDSSVQQYCRAQLPPEKQGAYDALYNACLNCESTVDLSAFSLIPDEAWEILASVLFDHPENFWTKRTAKGGMMNSDGTVSTVELNHILSKEQIAQQQQEIDAAVAEITKDISDDGGDYEIALKLYEKLAELLDYDTIALNRQKRKTAEQLEREPDTLRNIYGALVLRKAVCAGYAKAYQYLLHRYGIEALYVCGDCFEGGRHAWNIVRLEGDYYQMDVTWADGSNTDPSKNREGITYAYFAVTDEDIRKSRSIDTKPAMPKCTSDNCNYYVRNGLYFTKYDPKEIRDVLTEKLKDPERSFVELRFANSRLLHSATYFLCDNGGVYEAQRAAGREEKYKYSVREDLDLLSIYL